MVKTIFLILTLFFVPASFAHAIKQPVKAALVTDTSSLKHEKKLRLGVLFTMDPGWHIYWKNSGDSGVPTKVEFNLPKGFEAGRLKWPVPNIYTRSNITDYGYEESVLLWTEVKTSDFFSFNSPLRIGAEVSWISCKEICIPGGASLKREILNGNIPDRSELFNKWEKALPVAINYSGVVLSQDILKHKVEDRKSIFTVNLKLKSKVEYIEWFPAPEKALDLENISYELNKESNSARIIFTASILNGQKLSNNKLHSVVVFRDVEGKSEGVLLPITVEF